MTTTTPKPRRRSLPDASEAAPSALPGRSGGPVARTDGACPCRLAPPARAAHLDAIARDPADRAARLVRRPAAAAGQVRGHPDAGHPPHAAGDLPERHQWSNLREAWYDIDISKYFLNTVVLAVGSWSSQMLVATTGGFVLSVLRPRWAKYVQGLVLATLFVPASCCSCRCT